MDSALVGLKTLNPRNPNLFDIGCVPKAIHEFSRPNPVSKQIQAKLAFNMGGCQNYGPILGPYNNTAPNI